VPAGKVSGWTFTRTSRHENVRPRITITSRVESWARCGFTLRSWNKASCLRKKRFSAASSRRDRETSTRRRTRSQATKDSRVEAVCQQMEEGAGHERCAEHSQDLDGGITPNLKEHAERGQEAENRFDKHGAILLITVLLAPMGSQLTDQQLFRTTVHASRKVVIVARFDEHPKAPLCPRPVHPAPFLHPDCGFEAN
jgi:hypothetical protein